MQSHTESCNRGNLVLKTSAMADRNPPPPPPPPSQLSYMWLPSSLIYKCKVLIQVMWEQWRCWSICATQISNQWDTFLCLDSLIEVISVCRGTYSAPGCSGNLPIFRFWQRIFYENEPLFPGTLMEYVGVACKLMRLLSVMHGLGSKGLFFFRLHLKTGDP